MNRIWAWLVGAGLACGLLTAPAEAVTIHDLRLFSSRGPEGNLVVLSEWPSLFVAALIGSFPTTAPVTVLMEFALDGVVTQSQTHTFPPASARVRGAPTPSTTPQGSPSRWMWRT